MASNQSYDSLITKHYKHVAEQEGNNPTSTMADTYIRAQETNAIIQFVDQVIDKNTSDKNQDINVIDIGCGNGYTLGELSALFPKIQFTGIEKTDELREIAINRFKNTPNVTIISGDIRDQNFSKGLTADILICQRVIINLLDASDQDTALKNIINCVSDSNSNGRRGFLLFLESFVSPLANLNSAREEFGLEEIKPAHHNLYLQDDFFDTKKLSPHVIENFDYPSNFLSTHYYVTRALHPYLIKDSKVKRNSEFVSFFTQALHNSTGNYSPLKLNVFEKNSDSI